MLTTIGVRPRKFYATRHTFISVALSKCCNVKWVAEYCGTSVEMIEKSYASSLPTTGRRRWSGHSRGGNSYLPRTLSSFGG